MFFWEQAGHHAQEQGAGALLGPPQPLDRRGERLDIVPESAENRLVLSNLLGRGRLRPPFLMDDDFVEPEGNKKPGAMCSQNVPTPAWLLAQGQHSLS